MRRNITGIFIFEDKEPTCFEECRIETQDKYLENDKTRIKTKKEN